MRRLITLHREDEENSNLKLIMLSCKEVICNENKYTSFSYMPQKYLIYKLDKIIERHNYPSEILRKRVNDFSFKTVFFSILGFLNFISKDVVEISQKGVWRFSPFWLQ